MAEYELAGIETIARGICVREGKLLVCRSKGGDTCYLPGGHIEFGETGREALVREMAEETGLAAAPGAFAGAVESKFVQNGKPHAEINLVYRMELPDGAEVRAREDWIEFDWVALGRLDEAKLLPETFRRLSRDPGATFEP
ncbi:MAG: NUDIX domain-containing protein [Kiritimatiellae bacterium]|nr:NUDIX domain-containing protein [Kiritimatiellia bacterium]